MILLSADYYITFAALLYYFRLKVILLSPEYYITFLRPISGSAPPQPSLSSRRASSDEVKPLSAARQRGAASTEARPDKANQHQHLPCLAVLGIAPVGLCPFVSTLPRVWSPLQGYAPWALRRSPRWGLPLRSSLTKNGAKPKAAKRWILREGRGISTCHA